MPDEGHLQPYRRLSLPVGLFSANRANTHLEV